MSELPAIITDHIKLYRTDPEKAHMWDSAFAGGPGPVPTLLLTTKGRKTGKPLAMPLIYGRSGNAYVVIASNGGAPDHPHWFKNLVADPMVEAQIGAKKIRAKARVAPAAERQAIWKEMVKIYPPYDDYQARATSREIPLVVLDPVT